MVKSTRSILSSTSTGATPSGGGGGTIAEGGGGVNKAPIITAAIPFALTPEQANAAVPINYTSTTETKFFNSAILKLPELFDAE